MSDAPQMQAFRYDTPATEKPKTIVWLAKTDRLFATVQVITSGGETNLHSHSHLDGFWYVLKGRARFYSDQSTVHSELGPSEGVLIPRGVRYWFESAGDEPLEILQLECSDIPFKTKAELIADRVDHASPAGRKQSQHLDAGAIPSREITRGPA